MAYDGKIGSMSKYGVRRRQLAQNFFEKEKTVEKLVGLANFSKSDCVIEIGPGNGIITRALARVAGRVIAIEYDKGLIGQLRESLAEFPHVELIAQDFLHYAFPHEPCAIFANIPFNLTAPIMQKLYQTAHCPDPVFLVMQQEAADKFIGAADKVARGKESTESSVLFSPYFEFEQLTKINRFEFRPVPSVDAALLGMRQRTTPRLPLKEKEGYYQFVTYGFRQWKKSLKLTFKPIFSYPQWKRLARDNRFPIDAQPSRLSAEQWQALYTYYRQGVSAEKQMVIQRFNPEKGLKRKK